MAKNLVKSIKLRIAGKDIELSIEDARELQGALDSLFGDQNVPIIIDGRPYWCATSNNITMPVST